MVATASAASEVKVASTVVTALPSLLPNEDDYRGTTTTTATTSPKKISASAQNIIDSFPLLDFMQSTVLTKLWHHHWRNWKYIRTHCLMSTTHCSKTLNLPIFWPRTFRQMLPKSSVKIGHEVAETFGIRFNKFHVYIWVDKTVYLASFGKNIKS